MSSRRECQAIAKRQVCTTGRDYRHVWGALEGTSGDVAEWLDCALEGYEKLLDVEGT